MVPAALSLLLLSVVSADGVAWQAPAPQGLTLHASIDVYGDLDFNHPADGETFAPEVGTTGKRANTFALNAAALEVSVEPAPVGLHLTLVEGGAMDVLRAAEPHGAGIGPEVWRHLYQASLAVLVPVGRGLLLQAGIYPSHVGFESFFSQDNWSYTRSWLGELSPYSQAGLEVAYAFTNHLSAQVHLLNGWGIIGDDNEARTIGTRLAWQGERTSLSFNTLLGPKLPDDAVHWRFFGDLVGEVRLTSALRLATELDAGLQQRLDLPSARWWGAAVYARLQPLPRLAVALRGERFADPDAAVAGVGERVGEGTVTFELRPVEALIVKLEGRWDHSTQPVFSSHDGGGRRDQLLAILGVVARL